MDIHIQATFKDGVLYPDQPLELPQNSKVNVTLQPIATALDSVSTSERPAGKQISVEELRERINKHAVSVGTLPVDFSRADIYSDHD